MDSRSVITMCISLSVICLLSGCATDELKKDIAEVRMIAQEAKSSAEHAQMSADAAAGKVDAAMDQSSTAMAKAEEATNKAEEAASMAAAGHSCCEDNRERIDRMFRKAMNK